MRVSIIIPVYNVEPYIERCLLSVLNQTYNNIEIILIDDCGSDNSIDIAIELIKKYKAENRTKIIFHECNKGLSAARNSGINASTGEYIYFLDSDDELALNCIELLIKSAIKYRTDLVIGNYEIIGAKLSIGMPSNNIFSNDKILTSYQKGECYEMACNKLLKRELILKNNLYFKENLIHEDLLWSFMLTCFANSMSIVNAKTYFYYIRKDSITGKINQELNEINIKKSNNAMIEIVKYMHSFIESKTQFKKNKYIYRAYETRKDALFYSIIRSSGLSKKEKYSIYILFRKQTYINPLKALIKYNYLELTLNIKLLHYFFPPYIGFHYCLLIERLRLPLKAFIKNIFVKKLFIYAEKREN
ncbi:MAG: glycosyltransferase family 2 protein [Bacteroidales bacterium]